MLNIIEKIDAIDKNEGNSELSKKGTMKSKNTFTTTLSRWLSSRASVGTPLGEDPKEAFDMIIKLLIAYEELDTKKDQKENKKAKKSKGALDSIIENTLSANAPPLARVEFSIVFHLLNLTLGELYSTYQVYYSQFDFDDSLKLEESEFDVMLDFLCRPENMGKLKIKKSFEICSPEDYRNYNKIAVINPSADHVLEDFLKKGMYTFLAVQDASAIGAKSYINYLKFFPLVFSYFAEYMKQKVRTRMKNLDIIAGITDGKRRVTQNDQSFLNKLEHLGCKYVGDERPNLISFSTLEKALILFRNSYSDIFGQDQLQLVIKELREKCKLKLNSDKEEKIIPLNSKLLRYVGYRICLHCSFYSLMKESESHGKIQQYRILEEYTVWAASYNYSNFNKTYMIPKFKKQFLKIAKDSKLSHPDDEETKALIITGLRTFCRKLMPHISEQALKKMHEIFTTKYYKDGSYESLADQLSNAVFSLLIEVAGIKLTELIESVYTTLKPELKRSATKIDETRPKAPTWFLSKDKKNEEIGSDKNLSRSKTPQPFMSKLLESKKETQQRSMSSVSDRSEGKKSTKKPTQSHQDDDDDFLALDISSPESDTSDNVGKTKTISSVATDNQNEARARTSKQSNGNNFAGKAGGALYGRGKSDISALSDNDLSMIMRTAGKADQEFLQDGIYNNNTNRKTDVLNSYFIVESFLKKLVAQKRETQGKATSSLDPGIDPQKMSASPRSARVNPSVIEGRGRKQQERLNRSTNKTNRSPPGAKSSAFSLTKGITQLDLNSESLAGGPSGEDNPKGKIPQGSHIHVEQKQEDTESGFSLYSHLEKAKKSKKKDVKAHEMVLESMYTVKDDEFEQFLNNFDMKEAELVQFRRIENENIKKRGEGMCCTGSGKCSIF